MSAKLSSTGGEPPAVEWAAEEAAAAAAPANHEWRAAPYSNNSNNNTSGSGSSSGGGVGGGPPPAAADSLSVDLHNNNNTAAAKGRASLKHRSRDTGEAHGASLRLWISLAIVTPAAAFTVASRGVLQHWQGGQVIAWLVGHPEIPLVLAGLYVGFVFLMPKVLTARITGLLAASEALKCVLSVWNLFFCVFSLLGFLGSLPFLHKMVFGRPIGGLAPKRNRVTGALEPAPLSLDGSLVNSLCYWNANVFENGTAAFWLLAFDLSKIVEMADTVFLVLKGKRVLFLHWYHHLTVMLFCWHAHVTYISNGLWFAVMNMGIHTIMYFYYFCFSCGYAHLVRPFAPFITLLQIVQMVAGLALQVTTTCYFFARRAEHRRTGNGANCDTNGHSLALGLVMYGSYFVLFISFFMRAYGGGGSGGRGRHNNNNNSNNNSSTRRVQQQNNPQQQQQQQQQQLLIAVEDSTNTDN